MVPEASLARRHRVASVTAWSLVWHRILSCKTDTGMQGGHITHQAQRRILCGAAVFRNSHSTSIHANATARRGQLSRRSIKQMGWPASRCIPRRRAQAECAWCWSKRSAPTSHGRSSGVPGSCFCRTRHGSAQCTLRFAAARPVSSPHPLVVTGEPAGRAHTLPLSISRVGAAVGDQV
jgi:hypothetical protein